MEDSDKDTARGSPTELPRFVLFNSNFQAILAKNLPESIKIHHLTVEFRSLTLGDQPLEFDGFGVAQGLLYYVLHDSVGVKRLPTPPH